MSDLSNIASRIRANGLRFPDREALIFKSRGASTWQKLSFLQLDQRSDSYARGLQKVGITRGTKTILMVKPGPDLFLILFALFKIGAVPVIVDPGMGIQRMLHCYQSVGAEAFIGIPLAHWVRILFRKTFSSLKIRVTVGGWFFKNAPRISDIAELSQLPLPIATTSPDDLLMINFTTGSTGPAKGVEYTHKMASAMIQQIIDLFQQGPDSVTLATLPLFGVFDLLIGSTSVLPEMNPAKPGQTNPKRIIKTIQDHTVTHLFASPALLHRVCNYGSRKSLTLPTLNHVLSGGAPVSFQLLKSLRKLLSPSATLHAAYGATEALPICVISQTGSDTPIFAELEAKSAAGLGTCVGHPVPEMNYRIIGISDRQIPVWSNDLLVRLKELGEIVISGPSVSPRYHKNPKAQSEMKISEGDLIWHRTGDLGWTDEIGRLWFCGRKTERVLTPEGPLYTVQWEGVFNAHPEVYRSALVGLGPYAMQAPVVCIELKKWCHLKDRRKIELELGEMASRPSTSQRRVRAFLFHRNFPVDIRHHAKINRATLSRWADQMLSEERKFFGVSGYKRWWMLIPIGGWIFIFYGLILPLPHPLLKTVWWIDFFLSVFVHGIQLSRALPIASRANFSVRSSFFYTFLLGATWWKALEIQEQRSE